MDAVITMDDMGVEFGRRLEVSRAGGDWLGYMVRVRCGTSEAVVDGGELLKAVEFLVGGGGSA